MLPVMLLDLFTALNTTDGLLQLTLWSFNIINITHNYGSRIGFYTLSLLIVTMPVHSSAVARWQELRKTGNCKDNPTSNPVLL